MLCNLGSITFASLVISFVKLIQKVLEQSTQNEENLLVKIILMVVKCCFSCFT